MVQIHHPRGENTPQRLKSTSTDILTDKNNINKNEQTKKKNNNIMEEINTEELQKAIQKADMEHHLIDGKTEANATIRKRFDWSEFNDFKKEAYATKTNEQYEEWQAKFKEWYNTTPMNEWEKEKVSEQIKELHSRKEAYFEKQKNHPQVIKNSFIFQDELAAALTEYIKVKTEMLKLGRLSDDCGRDGSEIPSKG